MGKLTATAVTAALKAAGKYGDGDGLFLQVAKPGSGSWVLRVQKDGKRRDIGLGSFKKVGLSLARDRADETRKLIETGIDPVKERKKAAGIPTFREAAVIVHGENKKTWKNGKHQDQWINTLETYAYPEIGDQSVSAIDTAAIRDLLVVIWTDKPETAKRVLQRILTVLHWSVAKGYRTTEVSRAAILKGLPKRQAKAKHFAAMPYADLPDFIDRLHEKETWSRLALEALIMTAARSGEIRGATWDEIDLDKRLWTVPAERMKAKREHVVPLSEPALRVFRRATELRVAGSKFVFQGGKPSKAMSDMTLTKLLRDMKLPFTVHGFRSTFRDWVSEESYFSGDLAEAALAHAVKDKTEAAYRRGNLLDKRRKLMDAWADYSVRETAKVVRLAVR
ncbi:tyrosine-type recombinase/integrase [Sphingomonas alba]|uniref:Tyrosine-type recombinase/integrase n=1 Tax=Sphingomonas alba TaxID=2908208 RepID=A0ABT0RMV7_9SPHN|nr:site-specific integrase [Sphingomonas alba]MCL6683986.1 tyrosine-type recombinase/integrase [Sphingomonas alba]